MFEKAVKSIKDVFSLRLFFVVATILCLVLSCVTPALADSIDYTEYITDIRVDGDNDIVTAVMPTDGCRWTLYAEPSYELISTVDNPATFFVGKAPYSEDAIYCIECLPFSKQRLDITNIPSGSILDFAFVLDGYNGGYNTPLLKVSFRYYDKDGKLLEQKNTTVGNTPIWDFTFSSELDKPVGAVALSVSLGFHSFSKLYPDESPYITCTLDKIVLEMQISSLYRLQQETGKTNAILDKVEKQLEKQGQTLEDVLASQNQTNEKLEELPGEIGDEMQGILDSEKQAAESSGNDFVDQILGALPDPSTDVLAALKSLTDATAYTGTDAVLPIPAIVLPGIDGLFPKTVIWEGAEFDFGEYLSFIPSSLLTLVQSLFTIAIVLFCVYELKGIISYCLTLRENKGG